MSVQDLDWVSFNQVFEIKIWIISNWSIPVSPAVLSGSLASGECDIRSHDFSVLLSSHCYDCDLSFVQQLKGQFNFDFFFGWY